MLHYQKGKETKRKMKGKKTRQPANLMMMMMMMEKLRNRCPRRTRPRSR